MEEVFLRPTIRKNKAVSPVIATILLIVIAVATAIVVYTWAMAFVGSTTTATGPAGQMQVEAFVIYNNENASVFIRNTGAVTLNVSSVYVDGMLLTSNESNNLPRGQFNVTYIGGASSFDPVVLANVTFRAPPEIILTDGKAHIFTLVCADGTTTTYPLRKR